MYPAACRWEASEYRTIDHRLFYINDKEKDKMILNYIKQKILLNAVSLNQFGMNDLTWDKEDAKMLINSIMQDDIGVLGGNVYKIDSKNLIPMYDNWSCEPNETETRNEYYSRSKIKALDYLNKYPVSPNEKILFSIGFTENID